MNTQRLRWRGLLAVALLTLLAALTSCGSDRGGSGAPGEAAAATGEDGWVYVDGSGTETRLDETPDRIVAHANAAAALLSFGIRPVGIYADSTIEEDLGLKDEDLEGIEIVGEVWGEINVEAVAALDPDLIVAEWWPLEEAYSGLEEGTNAANQQLLEIAPVVGVAQGPSTEAMIEDYEHLAERLGADLEDSGARGERERFDESRAAFEAALDAKPDLEALAVSPTEEALYVAVPSEASELSDFVAWGMDLIVPENPDDGFEYWETLSWENAGTYQADLLLIDQRGYPQNLEDAEATEAWSLLDAGDAGATAVWPAFWVRTWGDYADALDDLTVAIDEADEDLVAGADSSDATASGADG